MNKIITAAALALGLIASAQAGAAPISASTYSLSKLTGNFQFGRTDWNGLSQFGYIDNNAQLGLVEAVLADGYTPMSYLESGYNGIYSGYPGGANTIEFAFDGGVDYTLNALTFLSSRSYGSTTSVVLDYALNGGAWQTATSTTAGALGIGGGTARNYTLNFGGVTGDAFRLSLNGSQISFHEITLDGHTAAAAVPEPASIALLGLGLVGVAVSRRRAKPAGKA